MLYNDFLSNKMELKMDNGFVLDQKGINPLLYDFQRAIVIWAIRKGRAAVFADCGLGKTFIQIEWLNHILEHRGGKGLIVVPLSVAEQTIQEAEKLSLKIEYCKTQDDIVNKISITNYERLKNFDGSSFNGIVLDESSILKSIGGKIKSQVIEMFRDVEYKLSCTATPAPNDISEMANQVAFLGIMSREEMLSKYFVHDDTGWRLKGHARKEFYRWMAGWSVFMRMPSDIGFSDEKFILPKLDIGAIYTDEEYVPNGELFPVMELKGIGGRIKERKTSIDAKVITLAEEINKSKDQWLVWCGLNEEANKLNKLIPDAKNIQGSDNIEYKTQTMLDFKHKKLRVLLSKPRISGFGMNFQNAHKMAFIGLSDSYEMYYQCIRRCWRFGQKMPVDVNIVLSPVERVILGNVQHKEVEAAKIINGVIKEMSDFSKDEIKKGTSSHIEHYYTDSKKGKDWEIWLGDTVETIKEIPENYIDFSIFSPPFAQLYTYSPSVRDLGNAQGIDEFWEHFDYIIPGLLRVLKEGRIMAIHCAQIPAMLVRDGYIGLKDFRGDIIRHFQDVGFIYQGEVVIDKNPQAQSIRTHAKGLTFSQLEKDSIWMRPALADYLVLMRKDGENQVPIINGNIKDAEVDRDTWIRLAHPIWYDVHETDTLNMREARSEDDERHICPLQLETIHNALMLWSNPGELIYSPFAGIGSEGYQSLLDNRRFLGCELKKEYYEVAVKNLHRVNRKKQEDELVLFGENPV